MQMADHSETGQTGLYSGQSGVQKAGSGKKRKRNGKTIAVVAAVIVVCAAGAAALYFHIMSDRKAREHTEMLRAALDTGRFYNGITVQGVPVGGMTIAQAKAAVQPKESSAEAAYSIKITYGQQNWELTQKDLAFSFDTDRVLQKAYAYARTGSDETRYQQIQALKTTPKAYSVTAVPDISSLKAKTDAISAKVARSPVEPSVTAFDAKTKAFSFRDGTQGYTADADRLWSDVKAAAESSSRTGSVELQTKAVPFTGSVAGLRAHMTRLGMFQTVSTNNYNGTFNMKRALLAANGTRIPAGGTFSFFGTVGSCDEKNGYLSAGALFQGRHIEDYGGGVCQSSTTIYGAALRSNFTVKERYNHALPSTYCKIGQDATVSYPDLDMKVTNPTKYPAFLVTYTEGNTLTAVFYGYKSSDYDSIDVTSQTDQTIPAPQKAAYTEDDSLAKGAVKLLQHARDGYRASAYRVFYQGGKAVRTELVNKSYYAPAPTTYAYGKGTDLSALQGGASSAPAA